MLIEQIRYCHIDYSYCVTKLGGAALDLEQSSSEDLCHLWIPPSNLAFTAREPYPCPHQLPYLIFAK